MPTCSRTAAATRRRSPCSSARQGTIREWLRRRPAYYSTYNILGRILHGLKRYDEAIAAYREAIRLKPDNDRDRANIGGTLREQGKFDEAAAAFRDALRVNPDFAECHASLGELLKEEGKLEEAAAEYREAIRLIPDVGDFHSRLGAILCDQDKAALALASYREAARLEPDLPECRGDVAIALGLSGKFDEAVALCREMIRANPSLGIGHYALATVLKDQGKRAEAVAEYREAIRLGTNDPARDHYNLGRVLAELDRLDEADPEFREAIRLKPDRASPYIALATSDEMAGRLDEALVQIREAVRLAPRLAVAHYNLGNVLEAMARHEEAVAAFRETVRLDPDYPEGHCNLSNALRSQGRYAEAVEELRIGHRLGSKRPGWEYPTGQWLADLERIAALASRLPAVLRGDDNPRDNGERLKFAQMFYERGQHAAAVRLWTDAFAADPAADGDRRTQPRYNLACAAALAATGQATDAPSLDEAARSSLRAQALTALKIELDTWATLIKAQPQARPMAQRYLRHWQEDRDLVGVRDPGELAKLPPDEQAAWKALWDEVASRRADGRLRENSSMTFNASQLGPASAQTGTTGEGIPYPTGAIAPPPFRASTGRAPVPSRHESVSTQEARRYLAGVSGRRCIAEDDVEPRRQFADPRALNRCEFHREPVATGRRRDSPVESVALIARMSFDEALGR